MASRETAMTLEVVRCEVVPRSVKCVTSSDLEGTYMALLARAHWAPHVNPAKACDVAGSGGLDQRFSKSWR